MLENPLKEKSAWLVITLENTDLFIAAWGRFRILASRCFCHSTLKLQQCLNPNLIPGCLQEEGI